jgi:macrophage erythroblast attacher
MQEYIEFVRQGNLTTAISHVKKFFPQWQDTRLKDIQQCMALLAFPPTTDCQTYKALYDTSRWMKLITEFYHEFTSLYSLTRNSSMQMTLEAGLAALKTPQCADDQNPNCPVCTSPFNKLASELPNSHHVNSCLVCRITGKIMDANNPPLVLPNGYVYSTEVFIYLFFRPLTK